MRREQVRRFRATRPATLARLCRVNTALAAWDEHDTALADRKVFPDPPRRPDLSRDALKGLRHELVAAIAEREAA